MPWLERLITHLVLDWTMPTPECSAISNCQRFRIWHFCIFWHILNWYSGTHLLIYFFNFNKIIQLTLITSINHYKIIWGIFSSDQFLFLLFKILDLLFTTYSKYCISLQFVKLFQSHSTSIPRTTVLPSTQYIWLYNYGFTFCCYHCCQSLQCKKYCTVYK